MAEYQHLLYNSSNNPRNHVPISQKRRSSILNQAVSASLLVLMMTTVLMFGLATIAVYLAKFKMYVMSIMFFVAFVMISMINMSTYQSIILALDVAFTHMYTYATISVAFWLIVLGSVLNHVEKTKRAGIVIMVFGAMLASATILYVFFKFVIPTF